MIKSLSVSPIRTLQKGKGDIFVVILLLLVIALVIRTMAEEILVKAVL